MAILRLETVCSRSAALRARTTSQRRHVLVARTPRRLTAPVDRLAALPARRRPGGIAHVARLVLTVETLALQTATGTELQYVLTGLAARTLVAQERLLTLQGLRHVRFAELQAGAP